MKKLSVRSRFDMIVYHGWKLYSHRNFDVQFETLVNAAEFDKRKKLQSDSLTGSEKLLKAIRYLITDAIPQDPARAEYRQGNTLGPTHRHWFRAKFGNGRYRLFFRYNLQTKIIIYAWVNDASTLRTYGSKSDAYNVFKLMLQRGNPPDDWDALLAASRSMQIST